MIGMKQNIHPKQYAIKKKIIVVISLVDFFANPILIFLTPINTFSTPIKALSKDNMDAILSGKYPPTIPRKNDIVAIIITPFLPINDNQIFGENFP